MAARLKANQSVEQDKEPTDTGEFTLLFGRIRAGDEAARGELVQRTYAELHRLARQSMQNEPGNHTLQPTALVNEVYLRLQSFIGEARDRHHFLRVAARAMRRVLVDHARARQANKRQQPKVRVELDTLVDSFNERAVDLMQLDEALDALQTRDADAAAFVELRFFAGRTMEECAANQGISERQAYRRWHLARAFLHRCLDGTAAE